MSDEANIELLFGSIRIVTCQKALEDGSLLMGGYAIHYDRNGRETRRTEPTWNCRLTNVRECLPDYFYSGTTP